MMRYVNPSVNQASLSTTNLKALTVSIPPLEEQKRIAAILDKADELRRKRREAIAKLDSLLQSVFLEMFGDPATNPKGFPRKSIKDVASYISSGVTPLGGSAVYTSQGILFIRSQNVLMNSFDLSDVAFINPAMHQNMKRTWVKNGDVLLNITGASIGRTHYFSGEDDSANVNQHVCIIRPRQEQVMPSYLSRFLSLPSYQSHILSQNSGATRQAFNFQQISRFNICVPPISMQEEYENVIRRHTVTINKSRDAYSSMDRMFAGLQSELLGTNLKQDEK